MLALPFLRTKKQLEQQHQNPLQATLAPCSHKYQVSLFTGASNCGESQSMFPVLPGMGNTGSSKRREKGVSPTQLSIINVPPEETWTKSSCLPHACGATYASVSLLTPAPAQPPAQQWIGPRICRKHEFISYLYLYLQQQPLYQELYMNYLI